MQSTKQRKVEVDKGKFLMKLQRDCEVERKEFPIFRSKVRPGKIYDNRRPTWGINTFYQAPIDDIGFKVKYIGVPT